MKKLIGIVPLFVFKFSYGQQAFVPKVEFGFCSSTYAGVCVNNLLFQPTDRTSALAKNQIQERVKYGWEQGFFLWVNLTPAFTFKPQFNIGQCVADHLNGQPARKDTKLTYSNTLCLSMLPQFIIKLGALNTHPIVRAAKCMSYYMLSRQPYLIMGPRVTYCRDDRRFSSHNKSSNYTLGALFGLGINNGFQNMNVSPEFYLSVDVAPQTYNGRAVSPKNYMFSATVAANFF